MLQNDIIFLPNKKIRAERMFLFMKQETEFINHGPQDGSHLTMEDRKSIANTYYFLLFSVTKKIEPAIDL